MKIIVATSNPNKVREIREIIADAWLEIGGLDEYPGFEMPPEDGTTFTDNARIKAAAAAAHTGLPCLADDSGLCVDALGGAPGVYSNRFLGEDASAEDRNSAILSMLANEPVSNRAARFVCAACVAFPDGTLIEALETCEGRIALEPAGSGGFGYDPIFLIPEIGLTLSEVSPQVKNSLSHRGKAVRAVIEKLLADID